jgi:hypothetical protein
MVERLRAQQPLVRASGQSKIQPCVDLPPSIEAVVRIAEARRKSNGPLPLIVALAALVAMLGYAALSAALPSNTKPRAFFGLSVAHTNTGLRLLWNPSAAALRGVTEAELTIADGDHRSQLLLSPGQIRSGNLFYAPFTGEVRFNLKAQGGDRVVNETVLALDEKAGESTALQGAVTFPAAGWPDLMSNLTAAKAAHLR